MDLKKLMTTAPPPPPSQVKIRTMRSDIESMMRSGGGAATFQDVSVSGLTMEKDYKPPTAFHTPMPAAAPVSAPAPAPAPATPPDLGVESPAPAEQYSAPMESQAGPQSNLVPIIVVTIVAILAVAGVGYFAYTLFAK